MTGAFLVNVTSGGVTGPATLPAGWTWSTAISWDPTRTWSVQTCPATT